MAIGLKDSLHAALLEFVQRNGEPDAEYVAGFEDDIEYGGYCETCSYEYIVVRISFSENGVTKEFVYRGTFAELMRELTGD